ncbi:acetyltransferase [Variovorax saccharolyticus]|uniref:acetyltransferase n=1 Tax=Variovorax saccharolyticus TaxID=3053516 RepID=UPI0025767B36|nr:acetyltransferase [Variovorax sp. J31P216]MDM0028691.1 acetyltransferase [Variovorax sp. J31P216]
MKKIILAGNAITAEILCAYLLVDERYEVRGLTVDDEFVSQGGIDGYRTVGLSALAGAFPSTMHRVIMAMGYNDLNRSRELMFERIKAMGYGVEAYVHPDARVHTDHPVGEGSVVLPGAVIEPHARVGRNAMVWSNVTLAHHSTVGDHCWVAAGTVVSGQAEIRHNTFLGVNSTVVNAVTVGEFNIVGAGALISRDTKPHSVHIARSAEPLRFSSEDYVKHFGI